MSEIENTSDTTTIDVTVEDSLDDFAAQFFGENKQPSDNAKSEEGPELDKTDNDAPTEEEDTHSAEDGAAEDEKSEEETETDEEEKPAKKTGNRLQERINEVVAKQRQAERERDELKRQLEELKAKPTEPEKVKTESNTTTTADATEAKAPSPTDKNEDGTDKYPLGEFDPKFVKDTIQHTLDQELKARREQEAQKEKLTEEQQYRANLQDTWNEKLVDVQERYPDFQEKGEQMLSVFEGIDDAYGQYLTDTLMEMEAGPEVFYYLANNLDEAQTIVNAGPRKATIALAKLEAQLAGTPVKDTPKAKVTSAPKPPPQLKGSAVAKASVPLDTDDLDAFSKVLFSKKK